MHIDVGLWFRVNPGSRWRVAGLYVVPVAQLVRAPGCGPGGRRFKSGQAPHFFSRLLKPSLRTFAPIRMLADGRTFS